MKKRITAFLVTAVLAIAAFAGCGKNKGITIAVPNDTTNEARALLLLEELGYITLKEGAGITATVRDIAENPYNLSFNEVEAGAVISFSSGVINSETLVAKSIRLIL